MPSAHLEKHLRIYKNFKQSCILEGIPEKDVPIMWLAYQVRDVCEAIYATE